VKIPTGGKAHEPLKQIRLDSEADSQSLDERRQKPFIEWHVASILNKKTLSRHPFMIGMSIPGCSLCPGIFGFI
jgi:hypothetical protein